MIIDSHNHVGGPDEGDGARQPHRDIIAVMDRLEVDKAVIFPFNETDPGISFSRANNYILEGVRRYPDRLIGFARLDPNFKEAALKEAERTIKSGLSGIKLHPKGQNFPPSHPWALKIVEKSAELGVPVVFDNGKDISPNREIAKLAKKAKEAVIILAHMRGGNFIEVAEENENIYLGTVKADVMDVEKAIAALGPERIIAGSDSPYASMEDELMKKFERIDTLSRRDKRLIRGENIARILDIS